VALAGDSKDVERRDESSVRRFARARDRGDRAAADAAFDDLVVEAYDIARAFVARRRDLTQTQRDDVLSGALVRLTTQVRHSFKGEHMGEFVNITKSCVRFAALDVLEEDAERGEHEVSFEARAARAQEDEAAAGAAEARLQAAEARRRREREEDLAELQAEDVRLRSLIDRVTNVNYRETLHMTFVLGLSDEEIAEQRGVDKINTVQQHRSRGLRELRRLAAAEPEDDA
jgi:RNA polymerase sigma factor (sigma-70 family)